MTAIALLTEKTRISPFGLPGHPKMGAVRMASSRSALLWPLISFFSGLDTP